VAKNSVLAAQPTAVSITATKVRPGSIVFSQRDTTPYAAQSGCSQWAV
jgi:hypothetical protein